MVMNVSEVHCENIEQTNIESGQGLEITLQDIAN